LDALQTLHLANLLTLAFLSNIPLGYLRESSRRYSLRWFVYIHLSIPFLLTVRIYYDFGWQAVPFTIGCAVLGQIAGGRIRRRRPR
jgi:hypothetical protein